MGSMGNRTCRGLLLGCALVAFTPAPVQAKASKAAEDKGNRLERLGRKAYAKKDWTEAVAAFEAAYAANPKPKYLYNAGRAYDRKGDFRKAIEFLKRYVAVEQDPAERAGAEDRVTILQIRLDKAKWPRVTINTTPQGAKIRLDAGSADPLGVSPVKVQVEPGPHRFFAELDGHTLEFLDVDVVPGTAQAVTIPLKESTGSGQALLKIRPRGALVTLNGDAIGQAPFAKPLNLPEGSHWLTIEARDHRPWTGTLLISKGKTAKLVVKLDSTKDEGAGYRQAALWTGMGGGAALLGGMALGAAAQSLHDDLEKDKAGGGGLPSDDDVGRGELYTAMQAGLLVVGGTAVTVAGVMWVMSLDDDEDDDDVSAPKAPAKAKESPKKAKAKKAKTQEGAAKEAATKGDKAKDDAAKEAPAKAPAPKEDAAPAPPPPAKESGPKTSLIPMIGPGFVGVGFGGSL